MQIKIEKIQVRCDELGCDWILTVTNLKAFGWFWKSCPKCGKGVILDGKDMFWLVLITIWAAISWVIVAIMYRILFMKIKYTHNGKIDTAPLRKGKKLPKFERKVRE